MIYGSSGADGDVDVDEPAGSGVNVASRRGRLKERRGKRKQKRTRRIRGSVHEPFSWTASTVRTNIAHIPEKGETRPEDVPQQRLGCLGRGLSVGHISHIVKVKQQAEEDCNVSKVALSEREERGRKGGGGLPSTCRRRLQGNYRWPSRSYLRRHGEDTNTTIKRNNKSVSLITR
jgi:hypothetical protein